MTSKPEKELVMTSRSKRFGPDLYCPRCNEVCQVEVTPRVQEWNADAVAQCKNLECGYLATIGVFYGKEARGWSRSSDFKRMPMTIEDEEARKGLGIFCPDCLESARIRTSISASPFLRKLYIYCEHCEFKGKAYIQHLELLRMPSGEWMTELPMHPQLRAAYQAEFGKDPERWRKYQYDGTRKNNALRAGEARTGHRDITR